MTSFAVAYLIGTLLGELVLLGLWFRAQTDAGLGLRDYFRAKRGDVILSASVALIACAAWTEGTLSKYVIDKLGLDLEQTLGVSVIAGAALAIFAHQVLKLVGTKTGLDRGDQ